MYGGGCSVPPLARDGVLKSLIVPLESFGDSNCARFISATWKLVDGKVIVKVGDGSSTAISEADNSEWSSERERASRFPLHCEGTELVCRGSRSNLGSMIGIEAKRCRYFCSEQETNK